MEGIEMNIEFTCKEITREEPFIIIDGAEIEIPGDFDELVQELCDANSVFPLMVYDDELMDVFEKLGLVGRNTGGGAFYATNKLREMKVEILEQFYDTFYS